VGVSISDFQYPQVGHLDPSYGVDIGFGSARDHCREVDGTERTADAGSPSRDVCGSVESHSQCI
jgi:hypothetical protein